MTSKRNMTPDEMRKCARRFKTKSGGALTAEGWEKRYGVDNGNPNGNCYNARRIVIYDKPLFSMEEDPVQERIDSYFESKIKNARSLMERAKVLSNAGSAYSPSFSPSRKNSYEHNAPVNVTALDNLPSLLSSQKDEDTTVASCLHSISKTSLSMLKTTEGLHKAAHNVKLVTKNMRTSIDCLKRSVGWVGEEPPWLSYVEVGN